MQFLKSLHDVSEAEVVNSREEAGSMRKSLINGWHLCTIILIEQNRSKAD